MKRGVIAYAAVLLVALVLAYRSWTHEGDVDLSEATVVIAGDPEDLEGIDYSSDKIDVSLDVLEDAHGKYVWVTATPKGTAEKKEEETKEPPDPHAPPKEEEDDGKAEEFKAGKSGDTIVEGMAPFVVKRQLEGVSDDQLAELGLSPPEGSLTIRRKGRDPKTFELGGGKYGGSNFYARDPEDGKIYLVDGTLIRPLQSAKRTLPDRTLVGVANNEIEKIEVRSGDASATFVQHNPDDAEANFWSTAGSESKNAAAATWVDKTLAMRSSSYIPASAEPEGLEEAFSFTAFTSDKKQVTVTVYRAWVEGGEESWYARSEHTRALVQLHRSAASDAHADLATVMDSGV
jgi:hypothetical protein